MMQPTTIHDLINANSREIHLIVNSVLEHVIEEFCFWVYILTAAFRKALVLNFRISVIE